MKNVLLHMCCGPCAITCVERLQEAGYFVTGLFYNPNIYPAHEYELRRDGAMEVASRMSFPLIVDDAESDLGSTAIAEMAAREGVKRCLICYHLRLARLFERGLRGAFDFVTTSLLYSKYQDHDAINAIGHALAIDFFRASNNSTEFYYDDFRTGWGRGIKLSKKWGIYRQKYCGCKLSLEDRDSKLSASAVQGQ